MTETAETKHPELDRGIEEAPAPAVSIVIPFFNEAENAAPVVEEVLAVARGLGRTFELILVDDGSLDRTHDELVHATRDEKRARVVRLRRNFGQTAAMAAGIDLARGETIALLDGDGQNDPKDVPRLLDELSKGADVASGWRRDRHDAALTRRLPSFLANRLISWVSGVRLHDYGCTLKAYRAEVLKQVRLYGEMHRFIPIYASWQGARVVEIPVNHRPRTRGTSKYGLERTLKVVLDLLVVAFLQGYSTKPIYVFGGVGLLSFLAALAPASLAVYFKATGQKDFVETPLPLLTVMLVLVGILSILQGLLAEMVMRTWFESQQKPTYVVREVTPGGSSATAT